MSSATDEDTGVDVGSEPAHPTLLKWTVKKPGKISPPKSDDYKTWSVDQLRKECTSRKMRISRKTSIEDRIKKMQAFDDYQLSLITAVVESEPSTAPSSSCPPSKHCCARLLTILFSDAFADRFAETGGRLTRHQLDAGATNANSSFWLDVTEEFNNNRLDFNELLSTSSRLADTDTSVIVTHDPVQLYDMWKSVNKKYVKALANFTKSGEHGDDFFDYCSGSLDAFYLRECLEVKHDLTEFVDGGMLPGDQFDSLKRQRDTSFSAQSPTSKQMKLELMATTRAIKERLVASTVDSIAKMHQLIKNVEDRLDQLKSKGRTDASLEKSASLYKDKLKQLESEL